jgi:hypothetical protein
MSENEPPSEWTNGRLVEEIQKEMDRLIEPNNERERICYRKLIRVMALARNRLRAVAEGEAP